MHYKLITYVADRTNLAAHGIRYFGNLFMLTDTFYESGFLLFFLLVLPVLFWRLALYKTKKIDEYLTASLSEKGWHVFITRTLCFIMAGCLVAWTLMSASVEQETETARKTVSKIQLDEVAFVLDVSNSMHVKDSSTGVSRLDRAKEIVASIIENLGGINISLTIFSGDTQTVIGSTEDYLYFRILLQAVNGDDLPVGGSNFSAVVEAVKKDYVDSPLAKSALIVLLTDGEDTDFLAFNKEARIEAENTLINQVAETRSRSLQWNIVGCGSEKGGIVPNILFNKASVTSSMQPSFLRRIAEAGGGKLYIEQRSSLNTIVDNILADIASRQKSPAFSSQSEESTTKETSLPLMPIIGALLLILAALSLPDYLLVQQKKKD